MRWSTFIVLIVTAQCFAVSAIRVRSVFFTLVDRPIEQWSKALPPLDIGYAWRSESYCFRSQVEPRKPLFS